MPDVDINSMFMLSKLSIWLKTTVHSINTCDSENDSIVTNKVVNGSNGDNYV